MSFSLKNCTLVLMCPGEPEDLISGWDDMDRRLSAQGAETTFKTSESLEDLSFDHRFSSPLFYARQTCGFFRRHGALTIIQELYGYPSEQAEKTAELEAGLKKFHRGALLAQEQEPASVLLKALAVTVLDRIGEAVGENDEKKNILVVGRNIILSRVLLQISEEDPNWSGLRGAAFHFPFETGKYLKIVTQEKSVPPGHILSSSMVTSG